MRFTPTSIPDVILVESQVFGDDRGFFMETYQILKFAEVGITTTFVQDNHSGSQQGILRGLHYQTHQIQGKLVRAVVGEIFDVAVDLRRSSSTFGQWVGVYLSADNKHQLWIPEGFAHGFYVLSEWAEVLYKTSDIYAPEWDRTLRWDDPTVGIDWPLLVGKTPILSAKDAQGRAWEEADKFD